MASGAATFFGTEPYHRWSVFLLQYQEDVTNYQLHAHQLREAKEQLQRGHRTASALSSDVYTFC